MNTVGRAYRELEEAGLIETRGRAGSVGTALHLAGRGMHRLRRCDVRECTTIFADTTRLGRQRYCSHRCANRDAVRRHRARTAHTP